MTGHKHLDDFVIRSDNDGVFEAERALIYLLNHNVIRLHSKRYLTDHDASLTDGPTTMVFVACDDVFAPGPDIENVNYDWDGFERCELYWLLSYVLEDERWGVVRYACWKRNLQPQPRLANRLKQEGVWDGWWERLGAN